MATGNVDCSISELMYNFSPPLNLNIFNAPDCEIRHPCLSMQPSSPSNISNTTFNETQAIEDLTAQLLTEHNPSPTINGNENSATNLPSPSSTVNRPFTRRNTVDNNENAMPHGDFAKSLSCPLIEVQNNMPEELFINVESEDEGCHSWRPNVSSDSLCSDFFLTSGLFDRNLDLDFPFSLHNQNDEGVSSPQLVSWNAQPQNQPFRWEPLEAEPSNNHPFRPTLGSPRIDIDGHVHSQIAGLNTVRYEVMNARRKSSELKEDIGKLAHNLNEKLVVQRALDVEKLKEENARLRLECQCLCIEVDYYVKGNAPLGEVDENFYRRKPQTETNAASQAQATSRSAINRQEMEDPEEHKEWDCHKCTFANHPAINSCEMCHSPRLSQERPHYSAATLSDFFKHSS